MTDILSLNITKYNKYFSKTNSNPNENFLFNIVLNDYKTYIQYEQNIETFITVLDYVYSLNRYGRLLPSELSFYKRTLFIHSLHNTMNKHFGTSSSIESTEIENDENLVKTSTNCLHTILTYKKNL